MSDFATQQTTGTADKRAKRLDTCGDRIGYNGALNTARRMYVLMANK
jgi:hypothetical protein